MEIIFIPYEHPYKVSQADNINYKRLNYKVNNYRRIFYMQNIARFNFFNDKKNQWMVHKVPKTCFLM